jgi:vacuolar iron transporter family protein
VILFSYNFFPNCHSKEVDVSLSKRLEQARAAYQKNDPAASAALHDVTRIEAAAREEHGSEGSKYIGSMVFGGLDGIITTFAVVSGVVGAQLSPSIIIIMGLANLLGDGISMALGAFISQKSEKEYYDRESARESWEIDHFPEGEKQELLQIYLKQGYSRADAKKIVQIKTADRHRWLAAMMSEELGLLKDDTSPFRAALITFLSFILNGSLPLMVYLAALLFRFSLPDSAAFMVSMLLSGVALFTLGAAKFFITRRNPVISGLEMLLVGGLAASLAYLVGVLLKGIGG